MTAPEKAEPRARAERAGERASAPSFLAPPPPPPPPPRARPRARTDARAGPSSSGLALHNTHDSVRRGSSCGERTPREPGPRPRPARAPPPPSPRPAGDPEPRAPRPGGGGGGGGGGAAAQGRPRGGGTRRAAAALTSFSATSRISTCNNKAGRAEPRAPGRGPAAAAANAAAAAALPHARERRAASAGPARAARRRSIFQEPGDEEVELCAGERDGETHRLSGRAAGGGGPRAESPGASGPGSPPTYPIAAPRGLSSHKTCLWVTSGPPAGHPAAEGKRGWCRRLPYSCHCVFTSRASAPPFKQRRRRRRRRRRKQQLSGSGYRRRRRRRLRRGSLRRRKESAAFAARGSACPRPAPAPPPPPPAQKKECLRPRGPGAPAAGAARPPPAAPRPKVRFIYLFPVEDVGAGAAGWLEGAFSVEADLGREGAGDGSAEGSDAHGAAAQALFSGAGWG
ncbi:hypothetical protein J1605_014995 [Eschrichtius robustus]|uniref:Uncharacterized protein n=1 Tax=Eschrichtius robustus TaxID=9764 RepID=A0AB34GD14_ESCRO|nr:hypothetical protein J1605_014995 [Eschrichtius robustus]